MKCFACGVEKDMNVLEVNPWHEDLGVIDDPIAPLVVMDCSPGGPEGKTGKTWKIVVVCHECWHKLEPDMWICEENWKSLNPVIPFDKLPEEAENKWDPESYEVRE